MNHHIQVFIPNYPPPLLPLSTKNSNNSSPTTFNSAHYNTTQYKTRFTNYLESRKEKTLKHVSKTNTSNTLKLGEASKELGFCVQTLNEINEKIETISRATSSIDEKQWKEHIAELNSKTAYLSNICAKYESKDVQNDIKNMISKRLKKRGHIRKRKLETCVLKKYETFKRNKKHQQLNKWLEQNAKEIHKNRQQMENKQRAEQILMDVKNRQNEAEKFIILLESVRELQRIRNRDKHTSAGCSSTEFNQEINQLKEMWLIASKKYEDEEKKLHTFLNGSDKWEEWSNVLFGEPTLSIRKKDDRLSHLIAVRSQWDKCIVSHTNTFGSTIPFCWAYPNANPLNKWKEYLKST